MEAMRRPSPTCPPCPPPKMRGASLSHSRSPVPVVLFELVDADAGTDYRILCIALFLPRTPLSSSCPTIAMLFLLFKRFSLSPNSSYEGRV